MAASLHPHFTQSSEEAWSEAALFSCGLMFLKEQMAGGCLLTSALTARPSLKGDLGGMSPRLPQRTSLSTENFMWHDGRCLGSCQYLWSTMITSPGKSLPPGLFLDDILKDHILLKCSLLAADSVLLNRLKFTSKLLTFTDLETHFFSLIVELFLHLQFYDFLFYCTCWD